MRRSNVALALASVVLAAVLVEAGARLWYAPPWFASTERMERDADYSAYMKNADGLRDRDYGPKPAGERRVLFLGDSFTFGAGVADESAPFPRLLEKKLGVEVLNGGLPGSLVGHWLYLWHNEGQRFDPDVVVMVFFLRDGTTISSFGMFKAIRERLVAAHAADPWYDRSYAYRIVRDQLDRRELGAYYAARFHEGYFGSPEQTAVWAEAQRGLAKVAREARKARIAVGLVIFPVLIDLDAAHYPFQDIMDEVAKFATNEGIPTLSLLPAFSGMHGPDLWVSDSNQHPNARAHAIVADALEPFVRGLLGKKGS